MTALMTEINRDKLAAGFISCADDFVISTQQAHATATWDETVAALKEIGLKTDEAKSHDSREWRTEWARETLHHRENSVVLGTEGGGVERDGGCRQRHVIGERKAERSSLASGARRDNQPPPKWTRRRQRLYG